MIRALLIATALIVLVMFLVRLSPLGEHEASELSAQRQPRAGSVTVGHEPEPADRVANSRPSPAPLPDRDVTPGGFTRGRPTGAAFARLPPRPPLSTPAVEADETPRDTRQVLLPRPVAIDAAHLKIGDGTIVLTGVAPLPLDGTCGTDAGEWPCGMRARTALRGYLRSRSVRCEVPGDFGQARETVESACTIRGDDIGEWVVRNGWAQALAGGPYEDAEAEARRKRRGIWR
ncbi:thermonuclease family protein [Aurantimonas marina]|uniref:thermonuclease family protein n=1 Tax=Aurantimonas marina TaxID=2780508 RepID=UPI0019CFD29F|nr:thermonuclease family protein [Aurantimonas marina]